ncbi:ABC transporter permease [Kribbella solani]|uniref:Multiple sugar transport system permease protein/putative aldouronate transport system permease protein n=1 Tax=Kribbella solani TaxID=236067 RepID=A0A841DI77_9ACTN|nr:ABC transporter permease subunit [Kribbella solani]MBB5978844.1 multiple sugar transport system permease protein/putative aldouronate transport system permease protein [Kribbella solani]
MAIDTLVRRTPTQGAARPAKKKLGLGERLRRHWQLYAMLALPLIWLAIFAYWPMYGAIIAFKDYNVVDGIFGSRWVGFKHFERFVESYQFGRLLKNTLVLYTYELLATFWPPILLALGLNMARRRWYRRSVQLITYAPHFISTVVVVGLIVVLVDPNTGVLNQFLGHFGIGPLDVLNDPSYFRHLYVWSGAWQTMGFSAIIYLAALTSVSPELHEAAIVDGASRLRRIWHIDLPAIRPVAVILLILNIGSIMSGGFEKVLLLQNTLNLQTSEVIDTYVYKLGFASQVPQFSYAAAIGLFRSLIGLVLLVLANTIARRFAKSSLW